MNMTARNRIVIADGLDGEPLDVPATGLLVTGRAGSGKSNLLNLLAAAYKRAGMTVAVYSGHPWDGMQASGVREVARLLKDVTAGSPRRWAVLLDDVFRHGDAGEAAALNEVRRKAVVAVTAPLGGPLTPLHETSGTTVVMEPFSRCVPPPHSGLGRLLDEAVKTAPAAVRGALKGPGAAAFVSGGKVTFGRVPFAGV